jgi:hypothetical protein
MILIMRTGMVPGLRDRRSAVMSALSALVRDLDAELRRLGYKDATMVWYRGCWRRMQNHFDALGIEEFSLDAAMAWVDQACGFFAKEQAGTLKPNDIYLFRVAAMLGEYQAHGAVLRRYSRSVSKLDAAGTEVIAAFQAHLRSSGRSAAPASDHSLSCCFLAAMDMPPYRSPAGCGGVVGGRSRISAAWSISSVS